MEIISKALFGIANSLLIPDIVLLIVFFLRALILVGGTYNKFMVRRKDAKVFDETIKSLTPDGLDHLRQLLPEKHRSPFTAYLADILANNDSEDYSDYILTRYETEVQKDVNLSRRRRKGNFLAEDDGDPLSVVVNLFDVAMVFAVSLMVAMVMHMNMTEVFGQEDYTIVKNPGKDNMEIISKEGKEINTYKASGESTDGAGKQGKRLGTAYQLENGQIIYVPE